MSAEKEADDQSASLKYAVLDCGSGGRKLERIFPPASRSFLAWVRSSAVEHALTMAQCGDNCTALRTASYSLHWKRKTICNAVIEPSVRVLWSSNLIRVWKSFFNESLECEEKIRNILFLGSFFLLFWERFIFLFFACLIRQYTGELSHARACPRQEMTMHNVSHRYPVVSLFQFTRTGRHASSRSTSFLKRKMITSKQTIDVKTLKKVGELRGDIGAVRQVLTLCFRKPDKSTKKITVQPWDAIEDTVFKLKLF